MPALPSSPSRPLQIALLALCVAAPAGAQATPPSPAAAPTPAPAPAEATAFERLINQLDDESLQTREAASRQLDAILAASRLAQPAFLDRLLEAAVLTQAQRSDYSLETRSRLVGALRERFMESPRAAMGIQFGGVTPVGVIIGHAFDGFPGKDLGLLLPQDIITSIEGIRLDAQISQQGDSMRIQELVRAIILSHEPGEQVRISILRPGLAPNIDGQVVGDRVIDSTGQHLDLLVPLGAYTALPNNRDEQRLSLENAWRVRMDRLGLAEPPRRVLGTTLSASTWVEFSNRPRPSYSILTVEADEQPGEREDSMVRAEGFDGAAALAQAQAAGRQGAVELKGGQFIIHGRVEPNVRVRPQPAGIIPIELRQLQEARLAVETLDIQIAALNEALAKPTLTKQERDSMVARLESARQQREQHKRNVEMLTNRLQKRLGE